MARFNTRVPQGSILGTLLFITYIKDIFNITMNATFITYADDTSIFTTGTIPSFIIDFAYIKMTDFKR